MPNSRRQTTLRFPKDFLFGTATAAHQIEGDNIHSDWWHWEQGGRLPCQSDKACDSWHRWQEDIDLAKSLHTNAYRFSLEWARIEPEEGKFDLEALKHYEEEIRYLHAQGMKAVLSIWHVTLPQWFAHKGGFAKRINLWYFSRFVKYVLDNLKTYPDVWITLNEPSHTYVGAAYIAGTWPPGRKSIILALRAFFNLVFVHKVIYRLIHEHDQKAEVGVTFPMTCFEYFGKNPLLFTFRFFADLILNRSFLLLVRNNLDFIGLNYYAMHRFKWWDFLPKKITRSVAEKIMLGKRSDLGVPVYPRGLYKLIMELNKFGLPIYVTENGVATANDTRRIAYIADHLEWLWQAIKDGADVRGYLYWTLMDNYEWAFGYEPKFGLCATDFQTFARKPRPSAKFYAGICKRNALLLG